MDSYLIEFRLSGTAKKYVKQLIYDVAQKFNVQGVTRKRVVPHVSIVGIEGSLTTLEEKKVVRDFEEICNNHDLITFRFNGLRTFGNWLTGKRVLAINIEPSDELKALKSELIKRVSKYCKLGEHDHEEYKPHATIAFKDIDKKYGAIKDYLDSLNVPEIHHFILRITLLKNGKILHEYDLIQHRLLNRREALNRDLRKITLRFLRNKLDRACAGFLPARPLTLPTDSRVFLISDLHLDHTNIIQYCNRPFHSKREMNEVLVNNWNNAINDSDIVFFLGDLAFGQEHHTADYWLSRLSGRKFFIRGNHDTGSITKAVELPNHFFIFYKGYTFMLAHKPIRPIHWNGWILHGEKHNNSLNQYPFINTEKKTVNVSVEVIGYRPVSLDKIISEIDTVTSSSASLF